MVRKCLFLFCLFGIGAWAAGASAPVPPLQQNGGTWPAGHVQGIAVDLRGGYIYYSFTTLLAKFDFHGKLVGTLVGWTGHLGDLDFNPRDGRVYGSLEYKKDQAFYIAIIDVSRIDRVGMNAATSDLFKTVYLAEVVNDYTADVNGDGHFDGDDGKFSNHVADSPDHRYDCSGIDGVGFGPEFGHTDGLYYLTVAYGVYGNTTRADNDHQVLLQYDITDWAQYARPLTEAAPHHSGPATAHGKYFVRTGNTTYGVQNLSYDATLRRWFLGVYQGKKPQFPNYLLFAVDALAPPAMADLVGVPGHGANGWEQGLTIELAADGLRDPATGVRGWNQKADVGSQPIGSGLFYLSVNSGSRGQKTADLTVYRWRGVPTAPFIPATTADVKQLTLP
jgi:hypothetical protein